MCEQAVVRLRGREDQYCEGQGELAKALNIHLSAIAILPDYDGASLPNYNSCLCSVDFHALAKKLGMKSVKHGWSSSLAKRPKYEGLWELRARAL